MADRMRSLGGWTTLALLLGATPALAAGTAAGRSVTNTATVTYRVGGVSQTPITVSDTFTVEGQESDPLAKVATTTRTTTPKPALVKKAR